MSRNAIHFRHWRKEQKTNTIIVAIDGPSAGKIVCEQKVWPFSSLGEQVKLEAAGEGVSILIKTSKGNLKVPCRPYRP